MISVTKKAILDYLLGNLDAAKEDDFLAACFSDNENAEKYEAVRDDLIESYLRGDLSKDDNVRFEKHFLNNPQHLELFDFAKTLRSFLAENKQLAAVATAKTRKKPFAFGSLLVPATAFGALLICGFLIWQLVLKDTGKEIAEIKPAPTPIITPQVSPISTASPSPTVAVSPNPSVTQTPTPKPTEIPKENSPVAPNPRVSENPVIAFTLPLIAKGKNDGVLKITRQTKQINLQTSKPFKEFSSYQAQIKKNEEILWQADFVEFPANGKGQIVINVPAEKFKAGNLRFIIFGKNADGTTEELKGTERLFTVTFGF